MLKYKWYRIGKGHSNIRPEAEMLSVDGLNVTKFACLAGETKGQNRSMIINYDRSFVISRIMSFCKRLLGIDKAEWLTLCSDVYDKYQEEVSDMDYLGDNNDT